MSGSIFRVDFGGELVKAARGAERIVVFGRLPNPNYDYYLAARLSLPGTPEIFICDEFERPEKWAKAWGAYVIISRYASPAIFAWIKHNVKDLAGVAFFLDDDIKSVIFE
jgi:hypothetical protein